MSLPLIVTPEAETDIAEARSWYEERRAGLGESFEAAIEAAIEQIRTIPHAATEVFPTVRRVVVQGYPYGVFYRIDEDQIAVIAVYHARRDPSGWQRRA